MLQSDPAFELAQALARLAGLASEDRDAVVDQLSTADRVLIERRLRRLAQPVDLPAIDPNRNLRAALASAGLSPWLMDRIDPTSADRAKLTASVHSCLRQAAELVLASSQAGPGQSRPSRFRQVLRSLLDQSRSAR